MESSIRTGDIDVSLIICSRNRCDQLARCLETVTRIRFPRSWELIIVDNGSVDRTPAVVREFSRTSGILTRYVFEPIRGLANGHNAAVRIADGSILTFTDDDCYPADDFLSQIWTAFADPSVGYIGGRILLHDPTDYPATINESVTPDSFPRGHLSRSERYKEQTWPFDGKHSSILVDSIPCSGQVRCLLLKI